MVGRIVEVCVEGQFTPKPKTQLIHKFCFEHLKVLSHSFIFPTKIEGVSSLMPGPCWTMNKGSLPSRTLVVPRLVDEEYTQPHSIASACGGEEEGK